MPSISSIRARLPGEIWLMNASGQQRKKLIDFQFVSDMAWSPDGSRIAICGKQELGGPSQLYIMNANGSQLLLTAKCNDNIWDVAWHPTDPAKLAVTRGWKEGVQTSDGKTVDVGKPAVYRIWEYQLSTGVLTPLTPDAKTIPVNQAPPLVVETVDREPQYSADGNQIYFMSNREGGGMFAIGTDKSNLRKIPLKYTVNQLHHFHIRYKTGH